MFQEPPQIFRGPPVPGGCAAGGDPGGCHGRAVLCSGEVCGGDGEAVEREEVEEVEARGTGRRQVRATLLLY